MAYLLDVIALALFALMVFLGYRRGFIRTVSGVLSFVLALVLSSMLAASSLAWCRPWRTTSAKTAPLWSV